MTLTPSEAFGRATRQIRLERGLSQEKVALQSGIDRAYYGHVERASKSPTLTTVWKVAAALEVPPSQLLQRAEQLLSNDDPTP
jgi:transcriptional regulator with XRE-family HTH domain